MSTIDTENAEVSAEQAVGLLGRVKLRAARMFDLNSRITVVAIGCLAAGVLVGLAWWTSRDEGPTPREELDTALELLNDRSRRENRDEAKKIALKLKRMNYRAPDFQGGPEYVLGIVAFRDGMDADSIDRHRHFVRAVRFLREAEQQALESRYLPEWNYAMGVSLYEAGNAPRAVANLERAVTSYPRGQVEAGLRLSGVYLDRKQPKEMQRGVAVLSQLVDLDKTQISAHQKDIAWLRLAMLHLALRQQSQAQAALLKVKGQQAKTQATRVFKARATIAGAKVLRSRREVAAISAATHALLLARAERGFRRAMSQLKPVEKTVGLDTTYTRQASYLLGQCAEHIAELESRNAATKYDEAINYYVRTVRNFPNTHESTVASLRAARLLRLSGRYEEAIQAYRIALKTTGSSDEFHNRWIGLEEFRSILTSEWEALQAQKLHWEAIELSSLMSAVFPPAHTQELNSLAHGKWALALEAKIPGKTGADRKTAIIELRRRRRLTGASFAKLARLRQASNLYARALWTSAENYRKGHDFENALKQYTAYIESQPKDRLPQAYVERARVLMDLDRLEQAREHLQKVLDAHPNSSISYVAQFLMADCMLEMGHAGKAESMWRATLSHPKLTPDAREWRLSLFSLGRHLYHQARISREKADADRRAGRTKAADKKRDAAKTRLMEAGLRLGEFLGRYAKDRAAIEARFLLAKTSQQRASIAREHAREADVENVRKQYRDKQNALLRQAGGHYRKLQTALLKAEETGPLGNLHTSFLRDCYFEIAHVLYALEQYPQAISAYNSAANRYPGDPQVLLAYLQMAASYNRLGDRSEAFSLIVQAEVIYRKLPDNSFRPPHTTLTKKEWGDLLKWTRQQHQLASRGL